MLANLPQYFLPKSFTGKRCMESKDMWGEIPNRTSEYLIKDFDTTGKYYTTYAGPGDKTYTNQEKSPKIYAYSFNEETQKLQVVMVELPCWYPHYLEHCTPYCPVYNRWFLILKSAVKSARIEGNDDSQTLLLRSGGLKHLFGAPAKTIIQATFQETEDNLLELSYPTFQELKHTQLLRTKEYGHLLVLLVVTGDSEFVVDLVCYDESKLIHVKHILIHSGPPVIVRYHEKSFSFDFNAERFFIQDDDFFQDHYYLHGYQFLGVQFLSEKLKYDELDEKPNSGILHHSDSNFMIVLENRETYVKLLKFFYINPSNEVIYSPNTIISKHENLVLEDLVTGFGKEFIRGSYIEYCEFGIRKDKIYFYDLEAKKEHILHDCKAENSGLSFNMNLAEVAFVARHKSRMKLQFVRLPSPFEDTLKHKARMVCLRNFPRYYLRKQNLPKGLSRYLDL